MKNPNTLRIAVIMVLVSGTTLFHYLAPLYLHSLHDIFQRFYYFPIILSALWFGLRGGLLCSLFVSLVYVPHVFFQWGDHMVIGVGKYLEIVLYNIVGGVTGLLAQKERQRSLELQHQSERVVAIETELRRAEKLSTMGEMAAVLAHEIRNPLGSIRGTAEILKDDYKPGDPKHEFIEIQIKETERLNRVVEDFLRMARPHQGAQKSCSLREELETIVTLLSREAREKQVKLELQPFSFDAIVKGDGEKLRQAFLNIIINALQATPPEGKVSIQVSEIGKFFEIRFNDNGHGIDGEAIKRIFEPFFTTRDEGTGLGLAITKKIIEGHGGALRVESEVGKETTVIVTLPSLELEECS